MHCHPAAKPYSWTFSPEMKQPPDDRNKRTSLWYNDPPTKRDKKINEILHVAKFTQSDFRTLRKGDVKIISACLNPIERDFVIAKWPLKEAVLGVVRYINEFSKEFISEVVKEEREYFDELEEEYKFYLNQETAQHHGNFPTLFKLTSNYEDIESDLEDPSRDAIYVFFSIEGCHVFNNGGMKNSIPYEQREIVMKNIQKVKEWVHPPLYVSMAHHINNDLCGHAKSLPSWAGGIIDQTKGINNGFTPLGEKVLHKLLERDPRRIYIDVKHMNAKSRIRYYDILDKEYKDDCIPVLASHGAVNGRESIEDWNKKNPNNNGQKINYENEDIFHFEDEMKFNSENVNFFDNEIIKMEENGGFLGIQIDERRLCAEKDNKRESRKRSRGEQLHFQAGLVWKQIRYIAEVLDKDGKFGWGTAAIGSDYDGLVDPPNGYWTSEDFGILEENLMHHATVYFKKHANKKLNHGCNIHPAGAPGQDQDQDQDQVQVQAKANARKVIELFMRGNARRFLKNFLHAKAVTKNNLKKAGTC